MRHGHRRPIGAASAYQRTNPMDFIVPYCIFLVVLSMDNLS